MTEKEKKALKKKERRQTILGILSFVSALIFIVWIGSTAFYW